jgi:hypothetical protein
LAAEILTNFATGGEERVGDPGSKWGGLREVLGWSIGFPDGDTTSLKLRRAGPTSLKLSLSHQAVEDQTKGRQSGHSFGAAEIGEVGLS